MEKGFLEKRPMDLTVVGGERLGTALGLIAARAGAKVILYTPEQEVAGKIESSHENPSCLPGVALPESIRATTDLAEACRAASVLVVALPAREVEETVGAIGAWLLPDQTVLHACKGVDCARGVIRTMSQVIKEGCCVKKTGVLAGPLLHGELLGKHPAGLVAASAYAQVVAAVTRLFTTGRFQVYRSGDLMGVELGAALSEVYAITFGMAHGLGFGSQTMGLLLCRCLAEMARLGAVMGAGATTFSGLSGLGDLTAAMLERSGSAFRMGMGFTRGGKTTSGNGADQEEGLDTLAAFVDYARKRRISVPILMRTQEVLEGRLDPSGAADLLTSLEGGQEADVTMDTSDLVLALPGSAPPGGAGKD